MREKPWLRGANKTWYVQIGKTQIPLGRDEAKAWEEYHRLMAEHGRTPEAIEARRHLLTRDVFALFLKDVESAVERGERKPVTHDGYIRYLGEADKAIGAMSADRLLPRDVLVWLNSKSWNPTTRCNAITAVKAAFSWAKKVGHLTADPVKDMPKPTPLKREATLTSPQIAGIIAATDDEAFCDFMTALWATGCRPGEVASVTAEQVDLEACTWTVANKTRHRTREATRVIYLTDLLVEISARLMKQHPEGPLFRNTRGRPWTRNAIACRFGELRRKGVVTKNQVAYCTRHGFVTDGLERGIPVATMAELVGHRDATMILRVYSKLGERRDHLREAARAVRAPLKSTGS